MNPEMPNANVFQNFEVPGGTNEFVPRDISLVVPTDSELPLEQQHFLISIPWEDRYAEQVDAEYRPFFENVLPYLHARTTDVHIAKCFPFIDELIQRIGKPADKDVIALGFVLHDAGWSQLSELEIANSLGVKGLALTAEASNPKEKHAVVGRELAEKILNEVATPRPLTDEQRQMIYSAVLLHDKPWEINATGEIPLEVKIICDVDHLWSFTHENFWQDTVRKGVRPDEYLVNLGNDLDGYFITDEGKQKARELLAIRAEEVEIWKQQK